MQNLAIVDLGSNSVRMAVNELDADGTFREVNRVKADSRLSEGMGPEKILQPKAMDRTISALKSFRPYYEHLPNLVVRGIATAAVRQARNRDEFLERVASATDIQLEVLSGDQEAYYDYLGAVNRLKIKDCLLLDTGGASCELVHVKNGKDANLISVPFGAVNLSEQFHLDDRVTAVDLFSAQVFLRERLRDIWWLNDAKHLPLVLLGGANRTLARMNRQQQKILHVENIHGYRLTTDQVLRTFERLLRVPLAERKRISGLEAERADIIIGGMLPLVTLLQMLDSDRVVFSESGVREGIISEYLSQR
ncbi:exopolyphosphatase [Levilactobacillus senmaizukei DSM 21775 = NBRC 103853]|uniref:Exopolyphosphatase n=1 Tax=Levilactobacillus senmaizukei DSM 21775 = NBRC 103853 TaxID=1423803 RepID=A0A0R2DD49_9LACO|nr:Ppx/GppA family phosphatase [Levilactobacillus senmaizukei]KRN01155.1 exopolyphosphatase [Levilactobacillus senmaizukei DSM 21775 = NBRC 103853]